VEFTCESNTALTQKTIPELVNLFWTSFPPRRTTPL
jgi:hypothetical protein